MMPNTKAVGVAYSDPEFESVAVTGVISGASVEVTGKLNGTQLDLNAPVIKTASFTLADVENFIVCNGAGSITVTFPSAAVSAGRVMWIKTIASQTVVSAATNVKPIGTNTAGTAILAASAGAWAMLVCDGTDWVVMAS
jgi:hypothetical protein